MLPHQPPPPPCPQQARRTVAPPSASTGHIVGSHFARPTNQQGFGPLYDTPYTVHHPISFPQKPTAMTPIHISHAFRYICFTKNYQTLMNTIPYNLEIIHTTSFPLAQLNNPPGIISPCLRNGYLVVFPQYSTRIIFLTVKARQIRYHMTFGPTLATY
jgi:hypothetical protein